MRIEKFEGLAVAIDDKIAIWFRRGWNYYATNSISIKWAFLGANEGDRYWSIYTKEDFEATHPGMIDDILRRLDNE